MWLKKILLNKSLKAFMVMLVFCVTQGVLAMPYRLENYTTDEIFQKVIVPVSKNHAGSLGCFADPNVWITKEATHSKQGSSWTVLLSNLNPNNNEPFLELNEPQKYVELERTLSSIVAFVLFWDGSEQAYKKFITGQPQPVLTFEHFQEIHQLARRVAPDDDHYEAVIALLIYSDLGKTPTAKAHATKVGVNCPDHDDWIDAVLALERVAINQVIPGYFETKTAIKDAIQKAALSMKVHFGHVQHLEGGPAMFAKLARSMQAGHVDAASLDFAFLVQLCDVAAAASHGQIDGFPPLHDNTYTSYCMVRRSLDQIPQGPAQALEGYAVQRAAALELDLSDPKDFVLVRLCCYIRIFDKDQAQLLKEVALKNLNAEDWKLVQEQFGLATGLNQWQRNPTYLNTVLLNLGRFHDNNEPLVPKYERVTNGLVFLAKLLEHYAAQPNATHSDVPLCLNGLAGRANEEPKTFTSKGFDPARIEFDEKNYAVLAASSKKLEPMH